MPETWSLSGLQAPGGRGGLLVSDDITYTRRLEPEGWLLRWLLLLTSGGRLVGTVCHGLALCKSFFFGCQVVEIDVRGAHQSRERRGIEKRGISDPSVVDWRWA